MDNNISIIVLSYNTKDITYRCLRSIKESTNYCQIKLNNKIETIVVDNASNDGSVEMIKSKYPWVKLIALKENTGFAKGNNIGLRKSIYNFILILNSDSFLEKETLIKSLEFMDKNKTCDLFGCKLKFKNKKFQPSGGYFPTPSSTIFWMLGIDKLPINEGLIKPFHPKKYSFFIKTRKIDWVMGAYMFLRRAVYNKTLGFNENYFMYTEEVDWCYRIKQAGFNIIYTPRFSITHLGAASSISLETPLIKEIESILFFHSIHFPKTFLFTKKVIYIGCILRLIIFSLTSNSIKAEVYKKALKII